MLILFESFLGILPLHPGFFFHPTHARPGREDRQQHPAAGPAHARRAQRGPAAAARHQSCSFICAPSAGTGKDTLEKSILWIFQDTPANRIALGMM